MSCPRPPPVARTMSIHHSSPMTTCLIVAASLLRSPAPRAFPGRFTGLRPPVVGRAKALLSAMEDNAALLKGTEEGEGSRDKEVEEDEDKPTPRRPSPPLFVADWFNAAVSGAPPAAGRRKGAGLSVCLCGACAGSTVGWIMRPRRRKRSLLQVLWGGGNLMRVRPGPGKARSP